MSRLYIIGNGFDIHHGIKSRYADFKIYVQKNDYELFDTLEKYFNTDELWSDFEETLAYIDTDTITDDASNFLVSYGADDWSDAYHHDYQYEIDKALELVTDRLKTHFTNWILSLSISSEPIVNIDRNATFLTFNYTSTLESIYNVPANKIVYIHNKAIDSESLLILGHSRMFNENESFSKYNDEDSDPRVAEGNDILDQYFKDTYKDTKTIIVENITFFESLQDIDEIFILGHSISPVDIKYFEQIANIINPDSIWVISYYSLEEKEEKYDKVIKLGIDSSRIVMKKLNEI